MADATLTQSLRIQGMPQTAKFTVAADGDVLMAAGTYVITAISVTGLVTGFSYNTVDYTTGANLPLVTTVAGGAVTAQGTGAGTITVVFYELPTVTEGVGV